MTAVSVGTTATQLVTGVVGVGAFQFLVTNNSASVLWVDSTSAVSVGGGTPVQPNGSVGFDVLVRPDGNGTKLYGISASGNLDVRTLALPKVDQ